MVKSFILALDDQGIELLKKSALKHAEGSSQCLQKLIIKLYHDPALCGLLYIHVYAFLMQCNMSMSKLLSDFFFFPREISLLGKRRNKWKDNTELSWLKIKSNRKLCLCRLWLFGFNKLKKNILMRLTTISC
jgi:hypothetical protein